MDSESTTAGIAEQLRLKQITDQHVWTKTYIVFGHNVILSKQIKKSLCVCFFVCVRLF